MFFSEECKIFDPSIKLFNVTTVILRKMFESSGENARSAIIIFQFEYSTKHAQMFMFNIHE